jgi:deazaflavin-dependent oxidoreductase (nitroreductase family)
MCESTDEPIAPSLLVRVVMRPLVRVLNPMIRAVAGRRLMSMAALLSHRGRRSGRIFRTPVGAHVVGIDCLVPLTFGSESDWSKNVRAAGSGQLRWKGRDFDLRAPSVHRSTDIRPMVKKTFPAPVRAGFKILGIKGFLYAQAIPVEIQAHSDA